MGETRTSLGDLVRDFEANALANRTLIGALLHNDRPRFYSSSVQIMKDSADSPGVQYLVELLVANNMLLEALCDPALNRDQAVSLGRAAIRVDPMLDASLARGLADSETGQGTVLVRNARRLMEVLCEIGDPTRMMASMLRLLRHPNPHLRSKAVKAVGCASKSVKWVRQRLNDPDPRIRANAVEALWSVNSDEARILLNFALADGNNRVIANALLGLYYLGDSTVLGELVKLAGHESPLFRASAAWAMAETGDPRFSDALRRLFNETDPMVRKRAFAGLGRVKSANTPVPDGIAWHVSGKWLVSENQLAAENQKQTRRLMISVAGGDVKELPRIPPLGFVLSEDGSYVTSYQVAERPAPGPLSVVFVIPRVREAGSAFQDGLESCLQAKRPGDLWCVLPYLETGDGEIPLAGQDPHPPRFTSNLAALRETLGDQAKREDCTDLWTAVWRASKNDAGTARGRRHVIILSSAEEAAIAGREVIGNVQRSRVPVQAIASGPNRHLEDFCSAVNAPFQACQPTNIGDAVRLAYLALLARYEVSYQPGLVGAVSLKVRVQAPGGSGETVLTYPK